MRRRGAGAPGARPGGPLRALRWAAAALLALGTTSAALLAFGALRPAGHEARAARDIPAPVDVVWAVVVDFDHHEDWRSDVTDVRRRGTRIEETDAWGEVTAYEVVEESAPTRLVTRVVEQEAFDGTWTVTLTPRGPATRVEIVERGEVHSWLFRALAPLFFDPRATAEGWLNDLHARPW